MRSQHLMFVKRFTTLVAIPLSVLAMEGCGGDNASSTTSSSTSTTKPTTTGKTSKQATILKLKADAGGALRFDKKALEAPGGEVTIEMKNPSTVEHNVVIEGNGIDKAGPVVGKGGTSTATADLKPGSYTFYCSVDGHEQAGMKGTLTVR